MDRHDMKREIADAASSGIRAYLDSTRGAHTFGATAAITRPDDITVQVEGGNGECLHFTVQML